MRTILDSLHAVLLRLLGGSGVLYLLAILASIPVGLATGRHLGGSIALGFAGAALCLFFLIPRLTPPWLRHPAHAGHGLNIVLAMFAMQFFVLAPMAGVAVAGFEPPAALLERYMAAAALPSVVVTLLLAVSGVILSNLADADPAPDAAAEEEARPNIVGLRGGRFPDLSKS